MTSPSKERSRCPVSCEFRAPVAWRLWPRRYVPNLRAAPGEHVFNAFLKIGLDGRVTFHGWLAAHQVEPLLREARALVFPSVWHEPGGTCL